VRIGTSVVLAPLRHPLHIAEEAAVVDVLSAGRLELGLGAGYVPSEFAAFGIDRRERYKLLDGAIAEVRRLLSEVSPRPVQERVPIWCGYYSPIGARRAGLLGEGLLTVKRDCFEPYRQGLIAAGHLPSRARMAGSINVIVCDDPERTGARMHQYIDYQTVEYASYRRESDRFEGRQPGSVPALGASTAVSYSVLTPDDAIVMIRDLTRDLPVVYINTWISIGGMADDIVEQNITLMLTKVAPALA
jgi:alkanesulfonate monooxygenase SsuD/methylene tetrahydromethanopterin reductase-like flavin-dependent oxidoreductase (luciferase family)